MMEASMKLNFRIDGDVYQTVTVEKGESVMAIDAPEKEGYHFVGWKDLPTKCVPGKELDVEAVYEKRCYRLLFEVDGETVAEQNVPYGEVITPPALEQEIEWKDLPQTMPASDITVSAQVEPTTYSFTMLVDDEVFAKYDFPAGADLTGLPVPERVGYDFSGWNKNYKKMPRSNLTVRGRYKPHRHTLTFSIEGEMEFSKKMDFGAPIRSIGIPIRPCYTFSGWGDIPDTMPDHDLVFTGKFEINTHTLRFILDGRLIYEATLDVGTPIKAPEAPQREGYMFSGWRRLPKTMPDEDFTAEGRYYLRKFKITYMVDGEEFGRDILTFGAPITALPEPEKEGMRFSGWSEIPVTMPAEDITITGSFSE